MAAIVDMTAIFLLRIRRSKIIGQIKVYSPKNIQIYPFHYRPSAPFIILYPLKLLGLFK